MSDAHPVMYTECDRCGRRRVCAVFHVDIVCGDCEHELAEADK